MKKLAAVFCTLAVLTALTACDNGENSRNGSETSTISVPASRESSGSPENSTGSENVQTSTPKSDENIKNEYNPYKFAISDEVYTDEQKAAVAELAENEWTLPSGETVTKDNIIGASVFGDGSMSLTFDKTVIRYAKPIFGNSFDDSNLSDVLETMIFPEEYAKPYDDMGWKSIKAGDKLDCGLTCAAAKFNQSTSADNIVVEAAFDGELTVEGILNVDKEGGTYSQPGTMYFYPDTTKCESFPLIYDPGSGEGGYRSEPLKCVDTEDRFVMIADHTCFNVGNIDKSFVSRSEFFPETSYVKVRATLKNICISYKPNGGVWNYADLVDAEIID